MHHCLCSYSVYLHRMPSILPFHLSSPNHILRTPRKSEGETPRRDRRPVERYTEGPSWNCRRVRGQFFLLIRLLCMFPEFSLFRFLPFYIHFVTFRGYLTVQTRHSRILSLYFCVFLQKSEFLVRFNRQISAECDEMDIERQESEPGKLGEHA